MLMQTNAWISVRQKNISNADWPTQCYIKTKMIAYLKTTDRTEKKTRA